MTQSELIEECVNQRVWAVVGFSADHRKYGHIVFYDLKRAGYVVYPVNKENGTVQGHVVYRSLKELPEKPAVVDIVVPPWETEQVVRQCAEAGIERVWMQPGAESQEAIEFCRSHQIKTVYNACAMVEKRRWPAAD